MNFTDLHTSIQGMQKTAKVNAYQQKTEWSCSAATLKASLQHHGFDFTEEELIKAIGARKGRGAETTDIMNGAKKLGFDAWEGSFKSLDEAKETLKQGIPIIADVQSFNYPGKGHYIVIAGYKPGKGYIVMDPNTKGKTAVDNWRLMSAEELEEKWWDRAMAPPHELMPKWGVMVKPKGKEKEAGLRKFLNSRRRSASAIAKDEIGPLNRSSKWIGTFRSNSPAEQKKILEGHAGRVMGRALREDRKGILTTALGRRNAMGHELARVPEIPRAVARFGKEKTSSLDILRKNASPKNPTAQERFYTSTKESSGDILGMNAKRRAKAESASAHPSFGKFAEAAFFDELIKIANMDTALGSLVLGAKAGGVIGGVRKAADPSQEPGKVGRVVKGIATGAVVGALLALGMQRNAAGKNTFGKW